MSWDISVEAENCKECGQTRCIEVGNYTWNVGPVYHAVMGFSLSDLDGVKAAVAISALEAAHEKIKHSGESYTPLVKGGGEWGTVDGALQYLGRLLEACRAMPTGRIRVT